MPQNDLGNWKEEQYSYLKSKPTFISFKCNINIKISLKKLFPFLFIESIMHEMTMGMLKIELLRHTSELK